ncbi:MAG: hypothetical protein J6X67_08370 [Treponema sp.]|nr:hypothetical protein [Treponema sp.]
MIFSGPAFLCKPAFQGSGFRLHCFATRLWRALPIGGRLGGAKAKVFFATLLLLLILFARPAYSQEAETASVAPEAESASPEASLSEREEYLEQVQTYNFWSTLGQQFKISSESEPELKSSFGFDFLTMFYGVTHRGFGLGLSYEKQIIPHLAQKALFSATFMDTKYEGTYALPLTVGYFPYFYPMSRRLQKLYAGLGCYIDYVSYSKNYSLTYGGVNFSAAAQAGYKILLPYNFMADVSVTYKMPLVDTINAYGDLDSYINRKIQIGIGLKYTQLPELIRNVRNAKKSLGSSTEGQTTSDIPH